MTEQIENAAVFRRDQGDKRICVNAATRCPLVRMLIYGLDANDRLLARVRHSLTCAQRVWWSWKFNRQCSAVGTGLTVQGRTIVYGGGEIGVGQDLCLRSRSWNPIEVFVDPRAELRIGNRAFLNQGVRIACSTKITIGDDCLIGDECVLLDDDYHARKGSERKVEPIHLEDRVWLGTRVIVLRGVTIGEGSVIGAGSVVTQSIPPNSFAAGSPARVIRSSHTA